MDEIERFCDLICGHTGSERERDETLRKLRVAINRYFNDVPLYVLLVDDMTQRQDSEVKNG